jgi:hypothetical protein
MLHVIFCDALVTSCEILTIEDLLKVSSNEFFVGF